MTLLLLQMVVVLLVALACGWVARKVGQTRAVGEIVGGILLGPSVLGRVAPHAWATMFPRESLGSFEVLSTIGLILFLFLIGVEIDYEHLQRHRGTAALASAMSIVLPFALAAMVAPSLGARFAVSGVGRLAFTLFLGISMSITAFPVLARILKDRGIQATPLGTTSLMCAAVDDVAAWSLLAVAMTLIPSQSTSVPVWHRLLWLGVYLAVMLGVVKPLGGLLARRQERMAFSYELLAVFVAVVLASAAATEAIGVHPLFGAFLAGLCFPRVRRWQGEVRVKLEMVVSVLLLPLFFALMGMRTRLDLLSGAAVWFWTSVVLVVSVVGKMGGAVLAARWTGESWRDAWALGALLNTRGLVELIVLNIAYNAGVFSPTLFTMLVVMALVTTMMTSPLLDWLRVGNREGV
jgi:Kef-type K+ transport system membrane component KefB